MLQSQRRLVLLVCAAVVAVLIPVRAEATARQTVAVMPFRDLTAKAKAHVGEAIREVVTNDLKQISDLRVVERGSLDKVLAELKLQVQARDLDNATLARVGKILGASVIVIGAYQEATPLIRLTARFVKVETSEVVGSAKVDGSVREFFRLQDRVTSELLRSAGLPRHAKKMLDDAPTRPELSSMKALDLYGQAATAGDDEQRRQLLRLVVAEDKNFSYAVKDLAELERRMKGYKAAQDDLLNQELEQYRIQIAQEKDPARRDQMLATRMQRLNMLRRYRTVIREARAYLASLPPGAPLTQSVEFAALYLVTSELTIRDWDGVLRDGEWYLQRAPGGVNFATIQHYMRTAIDQKRAVEDGKAKAAADVAGVTPDARWDLCLMGQLYQRHQQCPEAVRLYRACIEVGTNPNKQVPLQGFFDCAIRQGDFPAAQKALDQLAVLNPELAKVLRVQYDNMVPADE